MGKAHLEKVRAKCQAGVELKVSDFIKPTRKVSQEFKRYEKYVVLKFADIQKYLSPVQLVALTDISVTIDRTRLMDGKTNHGYVVVSSDEPYAEEVWKLIEKNWTPRVEETEDE